ncbi:Glutamine transport ATP-binding protein GlnQ [Caulifigura coniformis]|uniref:Glutamine transport ATP-binding protein GlnQ n=1 Tax=Caulifigura coniformis TaxID=2527983 RepID=A0A517SMN3_9PLAN|nr:amino acid ABC transporter ATP-binding protein [Caulifigura coniformis]QDT57366.1 Glutamine transport ATP-binding protein GlnQ [Caulifigura coniformis]
MTNSAPNNVTLAGVTKTYGPRTVLNDISATIEAGETVALIGPSGGGKSTMLRCINGLATFDKGHIEVGEHRLAPSSLPDEIHEVRKLFGMIFQDFQLFPHFTALENVIEAPMQVRGMTATAAKERAMALLKRVGLEERANYFPKELSGGQKQRVAIARALAMEPRGLLCDEITSALDPELKSEVLDVLLDLKAEGLTLIMVTHEIHFARRAADRVLLLADGRIAESGRPEKVLDAPETERAKRFLKTVMA